MKTKEIWPDLSQWNTQIFRFINIYYHELLIAFSNAD